MRGHHRYFIQVFGADDGVHAIAAVLTIRMIHVVLDLERLDFKLVNLLGQLVILLVSLASHSVHI